MSISQTPAAGSQIYGVTTVTITAIDSNYYPSSCTFTVNAQDNQPPSIACPADTTIIVASNCPFPLPDFRPLTLAMDNCSFNIFQSPVPGTGLGMGGNYQIREIVRDAGNNRDTCYFQLSLVDTIPPTITCPGAQTLALDASCNASHPDFRSLASASDNCGTPTLTQSPVAGSPVSGVNTQSIQITATDSSGNSSQCSFSVSSIDTTAPSLACPGNQALTLDASCTATLPDLRSLATTSDNCSNVVLSQNPIAGSMLSGIGSQTIQITATDSSGNSSLCSFSVQLIDTLAPNLVCPPSQTLALNSNCAAALPDYATMATVSDNCGAATMIQTPAIGSVLNGIGLNSITLAATDSSGNTSQCSFAVQVLDTLSPIVNCPAAQSVALDPFCTASLPDYLSLATASDNCGTPALAQFPAAGSAISGISTQSIQITAIDSSGNSSQCSFSVSSIDTTAPSLACPGNQALTLDASCTATLLDLRSLATTSDNCSNVVLSQNPIAGFVLSGIGSQTIQITATDSSGNSSLCSFSVQVIDTLAPNLVCPPSQTLALNSNCAAALPDYATMATVSDNCGAGTMIQSPAIGTVLNGAGSHIVQLAATDSSGNASQCSFSVQVLDTLAPIVNCPAAQSVALDSFCTASLPDYLSMISASDNCGTPALAQFPAAGSAISGISTQSIQITATDSSGNSSQCSFAVSSVDTLTPMLACPLGQNLILDASCSAILPDYLSLAATSDNCSNVVLSQNPIAGSMLSGIGSQTIQITATDSSGNSSLCSFSFQLIDTLAPNLVCPPSQNLALNSNCAAALPDYATMATVSDNCGAATMIQSPAIGTVLNGAGSLIVQLAATDSSGNASQCSFSVQVLDTLAPIVNCPAAQSLALDSFCTASLPDYLSMISATDNCVTPALAQFPAAGSPINGVSTQTIQITATDSSGNSSQCSFAVSSIDTLAPMLACPLAQNLILDASCSAFLPDYLSLAATSDNCSNVVLSQSPISGFMLSGIGSQTIQITATDSSGNSSLCSFSVQLIDTLAPNLVCPPSQTLALNSSCAAALPDYATMATVSDNCGAATMIQTPAIGSFLNGIGLNSITLAATDSSGNTSQCSFLVEVVDTTAPTILCPQDTLLIAPILECGLPVQFQLPLASDNCAAILTGTHLPGDTFVIGSTTVSFTVMDSSNNYSQCSFIIDVDAAPNLISINSSNPCSGDSVQLSAPIGANGYAWSTGANTVSVNVTNTGWYGLSILGNGGCMLIDSVFLQFGVLGSPIISQIGNQLCVSSAYFGYQWYLNGQMIPGADSSCTTIHSDGSYFVQVFDSAGCSAHSDTLLAVGILGQLDGDIWLFPNPAMTELGLGMHNLVEGKVTLSIVNMLGQNLWLEELLGLETGYRIPLGKLPAGKYYLQIETVQGRTIKTFVKL